MRHRAGLAVLLWLAACSSSSDGAASLTLNNPYWDRVNIEVVITKSSDCDKRSEYIDDKELVMRKNKTEVIEVPNGANLCWRHDRNPNKPVTGAWSGWSRATLFPGASSATDI